MTSNLSDLLKSIGLNPDRIMLRLTWIDNRINELMEQYPLRAAHIFDSHKYGAVGFYSEEVYDNQVLWESHVNELLERVARDENIDLLTDAELLLVYSQVSLNAPMNFEGANSYKNLFAKVYGQVPDGMTISEPHDGFFEDMYRNMRMTIAKKQKMSRPKPNPQRLLDLHKNDGGNDEN